MHAEILSVEQIAVLDRLKTIPALPEFYLAGGTALALRYGHRRSIDFDFFRRDSVDGEGMKRSIEERFASFELLPSGEQTLYVRLLGVTCSFFRFPYDLLGSLEPTPWRFGLASDEDLAPMKLEAIAGRGSRKDFVDMRLLCRHGFSMERVFALFERKYGARRTDFYHRLRALSYFEDAERQPMPDMLVPFDWMEARAFFEAESARLLSEGLADELVSSDE